MGGLLGIFEQFTQSCAALFVFTLHGDSHVQC